MPHQAPLFLRIGALVSSLLLLTGFVTYRAGYLSAKSLVTEHQRIASLNLNSIGTEFSQPNALRGPAELLEVDETNWLERDALTLMSGSKSGMVLPITPDNTQTAVHKFKASAAKSFSRLDRNGDGKLIEEELHDRDWRKFVNLGAVENDAIDFDGFLRNFLWYGNRK